MERVPVRFPENGRFNSYKVVWVGRRSWVDSNLVVLCTKCTLKREVYWNLKCLSLILYVKQTYVHHRIQVGLWVLDLLALNVGTGRLYFTRYRRRKHLKRIPACRPISQSQKYFQTFMICKHTLHSRMIVKKPGSVHIYHCVIYIDCS